ncbi:AbrB/MazE/SpoVT family DNA-binding domain-containing protein, partial [Escherichia coli]|uniref:AbrB/MazE/SpoVT family DNA-binding domain-containing protein n=1 Tax=Escherichia coli TaxID=562 RepID=UPI00254FB828
GCTPKTANNLSATGYYHMPSEYDDPRDSTDTQLPGEYDLFDLLAKVTEENLHAPVDSGPPVGQEAL